MMYVTVILINFLVIAQAIRVPTVWPEEKDEKLLIQNQQQTTNNRNNNKIKDKLTFNQNVEQKTDGVYFNRNKKRPIGSFSTELVHTNNKPKESFIPQNPPYLTNNLPFKLHKEPQYKININVRHNNLENKQFLRRNPEENNNFDTSTDGWVPIAHQETRKIIKPNIIYELNNIKSKQSPRPIRNPLFDQQQPQTNFNYLPQPIKNKPNINLNPYNYERDNYKEGHDLRENEREVQTMPDESDLEIMDLPESDLHETPSSEHEVPPDVPTKPIYPGEGKWAIKGIKHSPYAGPLKYLKLGLKKPQEEEKKEEVEDENEDLTEDDYEEEDAFTPTRVFAQVRKDEREEHLPSSAYEPRLRQSIKDSKIHTVYMEEGYEDVGYDHGGHEKNRQNSEGYAEFDKNAPKNKKYSAKNTKPSISEVDVLKQFEDYDKSNLDDEEPQSSEDAETSASTNHNVKGKKNLNKTNFGRTKEIKTTEIKNVDHGDLELEITSEVKIMTQPNNTSTAHKYVKIIPKARNSTLHFPSLRLKRHKRFVNDFPKTDVHKDFLDVLNIDQQRPDSIVLTTEKYPYYRMQNSRFLNKNSPLRYAEDLRRAPLKVQGEMSFYKHSQVSECPDVPDNINPIPERVEKGEKSENNEDAQPKGPRIKNLGDKMDCMKLKLFGDNPLDSPIFNEDIIEPPEPIFEELKVKTAKDSRGEGNQISVKLKTLEQNQSKEEAEEIVSEKPFDVENKPLNIYDLLSSINDLVDEKNDTIEEEEISYRQAKGLEGETSSNSSIEETPEPLPEQSPLVVIRRRRRRRPSMLQRKAYQVNLYGPQQVVTPRTYPRVPPKFKTVSEVFYKDDILPTEQLNVLADVMHNIKTSYEEPISVKPLYSDDNTWKYPSILASNRKVNVPSKNQPMSDYHKLHSSTTTTTTTTLKPNHKAKYNNHKPTSLVYENDDISSGYTLKINHGSDVSHTDDAPQDTQVATFGFHPPIRHNWSVHNNAILNNHLHEKKHINLFVVAGMKPPIKRKPMSYSDFRLGSHYPPKRRIKHRVYKRSSNKPNYYEIRRSRPTEATIMEKEDDYIPQRRRNFYYDVNKGRVVYTATTPKEEEPVAEEVEEEDEEEEDGVEYLTLPKPPPAPKPVMIVTTEKNGPSFLDVVQGLQSQAKYEVIPEPTKMPPGRPKPKSIIPSGTTKTPEVPKFVNFAVNLKKVEGYEDIPEKKHQVTTQGLTEVEYANAEMEAEMGGPQTYNKMQIFDISEYLPQPMEYKPTAAPDYSKYKIINRTSSPVRHSISSRYNSEDGASETGRDASAIESSEYRRSQFSQDEPEEDFSDFTTETTTLKPKPTTTQVQRMRIRSRTRPTTARTTYKPTQSTTTLNIRSRFRSRPTTTATPKSNVEATSTQRIMYRRVPIRRFPKLNESIPSNHKEVYTPLERDTKPHVHRRRINPTSKFNLKNKDEVPTSTNNYEVNEETDSKSRNLHHVEVFKKYDPEQAHGGNYRREHDVVEVVLPTAYGEISDEIRLTDVVPKPFSFYSDRSLPKKINLLTNAREKEEVEGREVEGSSVVEEVAQQEPSKIVKDPSKRLYYYAAVE